MFLAWLNCQRLDSDCFKSKNWRERDEYVYKIFLNAIHYTILESFCIKSITTILK